LSTRLSSKLRTLCLLLLLQLLCVPFHLFGQEVTVVQSLLVKPYNEALAGFRSVCGAEGRRFVLAETPPSEVLKKLRESKPAIVLAIGGDALSLVRRIGDVPIIYVMVGAQQLPTAEEDHVRGVTITIPPEKQLSLVKQALPWVRRIGVIYDPAKSGSFLKKASVFDKASEIELIVREVRNPKEVPGQVQSLKGAIDLFWMLPDTSVVTPETVEYLLLFSMENSIPILSFSEKYVEQGALLSFDVDPVDLGRQAGEMTRRVLAGGSMASIPATGPRNVLLTVNGKVAKKLGKTISQDVIQRAKVY
jgi:putative tryptophan/tyrosine transport system substrate-binding protein